MVELNVNFENLEIGKTYLMKKEDEELFYIAQVVKKHDGNKLKKITDDNKFKLICETCKIKNGMKILEIGFGEGDFMLYLRQNYNIDATGVSISLEQVNLVKSRGFNAYCMNSWDMTKEVLGTYDLILQCGNLEYIKCTGESHDVYAKFCNIIYM